MTQRALLFILLGLLLLGEQAIRVAAKGDREGSGETETEKESARKEEEDTDRKHRQVTRRKLEVKVEDYQVEVEGKVKEGKVKDSVKFVMRTNEDDGMRIRFEHKSKEEDSSASNLRFLVNLQEVVEYLPSAANAEFQPDATGNSTTSQVLRRWKLRKTDWSRFTSGKQQPAGSATVVHQFTSTATAAGGGVIVVRGSVAEADATTSTAAGLPSVALDANSLKVDVEVHGWQWSSTTPDSRLALRAAVKSVRTEGHDKGEQAARDQAAADAQVKFGQASSGQPGGRFRWADTVTADGATAAVRSFIVPRTTSTSGKQEEGGEDREGYRSWNDVYFSFLTATQAKDIVWDPQVGLDYTPLASGPSAALVVGLVVGGIALLALVAVVAAVVIRRRRSAAATGGEELAYNAA